MLFRSKDLSIPSVLAVTGSIFVLTLAVLVVQIATSRFESPTQSRTQSTTIDAGQSKPH